MKVISDMRRINYIRYVRFYEHYYFQGNYLYCKDKNNQHSLS
jgi:hypothetical protein